MCCSRTGSKRELTKEAQGPWRALLPWDRFRVKGLGFRVWSLELLMLSSRLGIGWSGEEVSGYPAGHGDM